MILGEDEFHVNLLPWHRSTWIVKGERQEVMTSGKNQKRSIFGAIELATALAVPHRRACHQRRLHRVPGADPRRLPHGTGA